MSIEGRKVSLKWFNVGELIPYGSKFIKSEVKAVGHEDFEVECYDQYSGQRSYQIESRPIKEERYLYEIPTDSI